MRGGGRPIVRLWEKGLKGETYATLSARYKNHFPLDKEVYAGYNSHMPQFFEYHGGGTPKKFFYTYKNISDLSGLTVKTLQNYVSAKKFNPNDLFSVIKLITTARKWEI